MHASYERMAGSECREQPGHGGRIRAIVHDPPSEASEHIRGLAALSGLSVSEGLSIPASCQLCSPIEEAPCPRQKGPWWPCLLSR